MISKTITISDIMINPQMSFGNRTFRNLKYENMYKTILSMKPEKWYPIANRHDKDLIIAIKESGIFNKIELDKFNANIKIKQNEKAD